MRPPIKDSASPDATKQTLKGLKNDISITDFDRTSAFDTARATLDRYKDQSSTSK